MNDSVPAPLPPAVPPSVPGAAWLVPLQEHVDGGRARDRPVGVVVPDVLLVLDRDRRLVLDAVVDALEVVVEPAVQRVDPAARRDSNGSVWPVRISHSLRGTPLASSASHHIPRWFVRTLSSWKPCVANTAALMLPRP